MTQDYKKVISEEVSFTGKNFEIVKQKIEFSHEGEKGTYTHEVARRSPGIRGIIVSSDGKILLTKEYRSETKGWDYRLPGGKVFDTLNEYLSVVNDPTAMKRKIEEKVDGEMLEETGIIVREKKFFHTSIAGASVVWDLHYFVITEFEVSKQQTEQGEMIHPEWKTFEEARLMCLSGEISEERSALVLLRYLGSCKIDGSN